MEEKIFRQEVDKACEIMRAGGVILYPTDTIWGIGCDATNTEAVERIFKIKQREDSKSMLSLVGSDGMLQQYVKDIPDIAWELIDAAIDPLTIIYDSPLFISKKLLAEDQSAGFRITREAFSKALCFKMRKPIVSTSANISGQKAPASFKDISDEIKDMVDYIVRYGRDKINTRPSNIIKLSNTSVIKIIR